MTSKSSMYPKENIDDWTNKELKEEDDLNEVQDDTMMILIHALKGLQPSQMKVKKIHWTTTRG